MSGINSWSSPPGSRSQWRLQDGTDPCDAGRLWRKTCGWMPEHWELLAWNLTYIDTSKLRYLEGDSIPFPNHHVRYLGGRFYKPRQHPSNMVAYILISTVPCIVYKSYYSPTREPPSTTKRFDAPRVKCQGGTWSPEGLAIKCTFGPVLLRSWHAPRGVSCLTDLEINPTWTYGWWFRNPKQPTTVWMVLKTW